MRIALVIATIAALTTAVRSDAPTAETLYQQGQSAYDSGDYATAIARWEASYEATLEPALLFNVAQAQRLSGDCPSALATYRRFVAADPTSDQAQLAEDLARELEARCGATGEKTAPPVDLPKAKDPIERLDLVDLLNGHEDRGQPLKIAGIATGGAGVASIAIGLGLGIHARTLGEEVTTACRAGCDWSAQRDKDAAGRRDAAIGYALDGLGVGAVVVGAATYYLGWRRSTIDVSPIPREGGAIASWSGSW